MAKKKAAAKKIDPPDFKPKKGYIFDPKRGYIKLKPKK
jgi:hypothetical protein